MNLDPAAPSLESSVPGLEAQIRAEMPEIESYKMICEGTFEIACNWKVYIENGIECYHCAPAHPGFCAIVDLDRYEIGAYPGFTRHWGQMKAGGRYSSWKIFPSTTIRSSTDGPAVVAFRLRPVAPDRVVQTMTLYGPAACLADRERLYRDWIDTSFLREDIALAESVQVGLSSRGFPGGLIMRSEGYESEHLLAEFQDWVRRALEAGA